MMAINEISRSTPDRITFQLEATKLKIQLASLLKAAQAKATANPYQQKRQFLLFKERRVEKERSNTLPEESNKEEIIHEESDVIKLQFQKDRMEQMLAEAKEYAKERDQAAQKLEILQGEQELELKYWKASANEKENILKCLTEQNNQRFEQIESLTKQLSEEKQSKEGILELVQTLKTSQDEIQNRLSTLNMYLKEIESSAFEFKSESVRAKDKVLLQNRLIEELVSADEKAQRHTCILEKDNTELRLQLVQAQGLLEEKSLELDQRKAKTNYQSQCIESLNAQIREQNTSIQGYEKERDGNNDTIRVMQATIDRTNQRIGQLSEQLSFKEQELLDKQVKLTEQIEELEQKVGYLQQELCDKNSRIQTLESSVSELERSKTKKQEEMECRYKALENTLKAHQRKEEHHRSADDEGHGGEESLDTPQVRSNQEQLHGPRTFHPPVLSSSQATTPSSEISLSRMKASTDHRQGQLQSASGKTVLTSKEEIGGNMNHARQHQQPVANRKRSHLAESPTLQQSRLRKTFHGSKSSHHETVVSGIDVADIFCSYCGEESFGLMLQCSKCGVSQFHAHCCPPASSLEHDKEEGGSRTSSEEKQQLSLISERGGETLPNTKDGNFISSKMTTDGEKRVHLLLCLHCRQQTKGAINSS